MRHQLERRAIVLALSLIAVATPETVARAQRASSAVRAALATVSPGKTYFLLLKDRSSVVGRILSVGETSLQLESAAGVSTIWIDTITLIQEASPSEVRDGRFYPPNPNATRLIVGPTGRMLAKNEGYFSDYLVFFPGFSLGVTDRFSIGGSASILPGLDLDKRLFMFAPKVGIVQGRRFNAAVGALAGELPFAESGDMGILYGVSTWGRADQSLTAGLGYRFQNGRLAGRPVVMVGGEAVGDARVSFVTENYWLPDRAVLISGGLRFIAPGSSVDFGIVRIVRPGDERNVWFPLVGVAVNW
jgi:hypothetical protein